MKQAVRQLLRQDVTAGADIRTCAIAYSAALCLATTAQAQTFSKPVALTPQPASDSSVAALDTLEHQLVQASGRTITLWVNGLDLTGVFYAPLSLFWQVDEATDVVNGQARITRTADQIYLDWGGRLLLAEITITPLEDNGRHPLAVFHDRLLSRPLAHPVGTLPAGTRFSRYAGQSGGGIVDYPGDSPDASEIWRSLGDHIVVTRRDGSTNLLPWADLDAALRQEKDG